MTDLLLLFQTIPGIPEYIFKGNGVSEVVSVHNLVKNASMLLMTLGLVVGFMMDYFGFLSKWNVTLTTFLGRIVKVAILFIGFQAFFALPMLVGVGVAEGIDKYWNVIAYSPGLIDGSVPTPTPSPNPNATPTPTSTNTPTPGGTITKTNWISWITGLAYSATTGTLVQGFMVLCYILFAIVSLVICALWLTMAIILYIIGPLAVVMGLIPNYGEKLFHHYWASLIQCALWPVWLAICHKLISSAFFDTAIMRNSYGVATGTSGPMGFTEAGLNDVRMTAYVVVFMLLYGMTPFVINYIFPLSTFGNAVTAAASKIGDVAKFAAGAAIGVATGGTGAAALLGKEAIRGAAFARGLADMTASKTGKMAAEKGAGSLKNSATNAAGKNASKRADLSAVAGNAQNAGKTSGEMPNFLNDLNKAQEASSAASSAVDSTSAATSDSSSASFTNGGRGDLSNTTSAASSGAGSSSSSGTVSTSNNGSSINSNRASISNDSSVSNSQAVKTGGVQDLTTNDKSSVSSSGNREVVANSRQVSDSTNGSSQSNQANQNTTSSNDVSRANNANITSSQNGSVSQQNSVSQGNNVAQQTSSSQQNSVGQQNSVNQQNSVGQQNSVNQSGSVTDTTSASRSSSMDQNTAASQNNAVNSQNTSSQGTNTAQNANFNQSSSLSNSANRSILNNEAVSSQHNTGVSHQANIASGSNVNAGNMTGGGNSTGFSEGVSGSSQQSSGGGSLGGSHTDAQTSGTLNEPASYNGGSANMTDASQVASSQMPSFNSDSSSALPVSDSGTAGVPYNPVQNPVQTYESFISDLPLDENVGQANSPLPSNYDTPNNSSAASFETPSYNTPPELGGGYSPQDLPPPVPMPTGNPINEIRVDNNAVANVYEQPSTAPNYIDLPVVNNNSTSGFADTNLQSDLPEGNTGKVVSDEIKQEKMDARDINSIVDNLFND
jgi:hypothetical protein